MEDITKAIPGKRYRHYKGGIDTVLHLARHTETDEILRKYKDYVLQAAEHDIIYSVDVAEVIDELTEEDAIQLAKLGWHISEHGCFARFV